MADMGPEALLARADEYADHAVEKLNRAAELAEMLTGKALLQAPPELLAQGVQALTTMAAGDFTAATYWLKRREVAA